LWHPGLSEDDPPCLDQDVQPLRLDGNSAMGHHDPGLGGKGESLARCGSVVGSVTPQVDGIGASQDCLRCDPVGLHDAPRLGRAADHEALHKADGGTTHPGFGPPRCRTPALVGGEDRDPQNAPQAGDHVIARILVLLHHDLRA
jgi:hypothetical protein